MREFYARRSIILLLAGAVVAGTFGLLGPPAPTPSQTSMSFWEAAGRGLVTVVSVNETFTENGHPVTAPAGILVTNLAAVPVVISEEAVLLSPHPSQSPPPNPASTTADAVLTNATIPAGGMLLYNASEFVLPGFLKGPIWWDMEENHTAQGGIAYRVGGETLPFALRDLIEHPYYKGQSDNTQVRIYAYQRSDPLVAVGKLPLWDSTNGSAGQTVRVRIDATNMAAWSYTDGYTANVNVTNGVVEDTVPAGWSVEEGSFSIPRPWVMNNSDGSRTLRWNDSIPAADLNGHNDSLPMGFGNVSHFYTLVAPALGAGSAILPRALSDMNRTGTPDAHSAPVAISGNQPPTVDAGGPYSANEGDTLVLSASRSQDPDGDPLTYRWSFTDNGTWDTAWSSSPTASVRYTDEFAGSARVEVSDGFSTVDAVAPVTVRNVPPSIRSLTASASTSADFGLVVAGEKYHDVTFHLTANGTDLADLRVVRKPGDPKDASNRTGLLAMNLSMPIEVRVLYTPADDPVNGQANGDSPAWLVITFANGSSVRRFHNFNVKHEATWMWDLGDLRGSLFPQGVTLRAHLVDPGADALTAHWDFGDGTNLTQVFPNGPGNDTPEAVVGGSPTDVMATVVHTFPSGRTFTVTLTVTDADGASTSATIVISGD